MITKRAPGPWELGIADEVVEAIFANRKGHGGKVGIVHRQMSRLDVKAAVLVTLRRASSLELLEVAVRLLRQLRTMNDGLCWLCGGDGAMGTNGDGSAIQCQACAEQTEARTVIAKATEKK